MSNILAKFPARILSNSIKKTKNDDSIYIVCRAIVIDVDTVGGKFNNGKSPQNSIKAKIIKPNIDTTDYSETILWPISDYFVEPIFPTEEVLCIFETDNFDFGYWISRISNINKSYVSATNYVNTNENNDSAAAFGESQEQNITLDDIAKSRQNLNEEILKYNKFNKQFKFEKRQQDTVIASKNTARIVIGNDRTNSIDSGHEDGEAIDIVCGVEKENGDPDFDNDKSRLYVSSRSNTIQELNNEDGQAIWFIKSDNGALIARKNILIQSKDGNSKIKFNENGKIEIINNNEVIVTANKIVNNGNTIIGGNVGNKILTTTGLDIGSLISTAGELLEKAGNDPVLLSVAPTAAGFIVSASETLKQLGTAIKISTNSEAN